MNDFDRYVERFSRALPAGRRKDWAREVRADLDAELESVLGRDPAADPSALMRQIVRERQDPVELAASIVPTSDTLIGRKVYPWYRFTLALALIASLLAVAAASLAVGGLNPRSVMMSLSGMATAGVIVFTVVTLVFAAAQRLGADMPAMAPVGLRWMVQARRIDTAPGNATLVAMLFLALLLDLFPRAIGLLLVIDDPGLRIAIFPVLSADFAGTPRLLLNAWCAIAVAAWWVGRSRGPIHPATRVAGACVRLAGLAIWGYILATSPVFAVPGADTLATFPQPLAEAMSRTVAPMLYQVLRAVLVLGWAWHATLFVLGLRATHAPDPGAAGQA